MSHSYSEERVLEIKEFLAKTWKIFSAVIIIGLLIVWGWRYWQSSNAEKLADASEQYQLLVTKLNTNEPKSVDELVQFAQQNDSIYSVFASLQAANFYVEDIKDYTKAQTLLSDATKKTDSEPVLAMINMRIARLQYQQGEYDASLQSLAKVTDNSWAAAINDIRGDVFVKMKHYSQACDAYEVALASKPTQALEQNIKIKLNQAEYLKVKQESEQVVKDPATKQISDNRAETSAQ